jgi:glutaryl-CoA dehydrogenase
MSLLKKIKASVNILQSLDFVKLGQLAEKVDLNKMVGLVSGMKEEDLQKLVKYLEGGKKKHDFPEIDTDFYDLHQLLSSEERAIQLQVRDFMQKEI